LKHGFETQAVDRLISCIAPDNKASQAVAQRLGMRKGEASALVIRGQSHPVEIWSITRVDFYRRPGNQGWSGG
jgi:RimJ/RimL family protein N-acetyltransferase